ncbi:MAG: aminoacyl-tRNA hydrolase [Caldilineales bacterium]
MKLIIGLGNPGKQYEAHRHNAGFQIVDLLAQRHGLSFSKKQGNANIALGELRVVGPPTPPLAEGDTSAPSASPWLTLRVLLAKPLTFMNRVGASAAALARFYKVDPADILVIYDELDLPLATLRLRAGGGSGGHNGMKSLIEALGTQQFARLRVGIDRPPGRMDPADYVLQPFSAVQETLMQQARPLAADACEQWLGLGVTAAMNTVNATRPAATA